MEGCSLKTLRNSLCILRICLDNAMKRMNTFVDYRLKRVGSKRVPRNAEAKIAQEECSKRAGTELEQEIIKKQKVDADKETAELQRLIEIVPDKEEVAIDAIHLATKTPSIVDYKIYKEEKKIYYQIIRANRSLKMARGGLERVLWGDLRQCFDPHVDRSKYGGFNRASRCWSGKYDTSCGVHSLRMQHMHIYMLVEKRCPLTPATVTDMLNKKLQFTRLKIMKKYDYGHLDKIEVHREDQQLHTFREDAPVMITASIAAKPYQEDSSEFYLITGSIYTDQRGTVAFLIVAAARRRQRRSVKVKELQERCIIKAFKLKNQEKYEHVGPKVTSAQDGEISQVDDKGDWRDSKEKCSFEVHMASTREMLGKTYVESGNISFTPQQFEQLLKSVQQMGVFNAADEEIDHQFAAGIACLNSQINMLKLLEDWIYDTGASEHMTSVDESIYDPCVLKIKPQINMHNGDTLVLSHIGKVKLKNGLVIKDVLVVPSFKFSLLSVPKLTEDSQCVVSFYPKFCVVQDMTTRKVRGLGKLKDGLYHLVNLPSEQVDSVFTNLVYNTMQKFALSVVNKDISNSYAL
ncbi:hypothetical protein Tco_0374516 [Tanacetum coccineum]